MAKVLTGISGNLISAASAGFAPTNSADVSAIASAYQVVSATATQLYAGTAYVTSVNDAPISAARAGNAANASLANSAWYDGTGRLISSLPDSAAVSAIASAYAESAASGKQDELTFSYDDDKISAINGSALAGQGGGGEQVVTSLQYAVSESTSKYELYQPAGTTGGSMSSNLLAFDDPEYGMGQYDMSGLSSFDVFMTGMDSNFDYYSATMSAMIVKASASGIQPWVWSPSDTAFCGFLVSVQTGTIGYDQTGSARVSAVGLRHYGSSWPDGTPFYVQPPLIFFTNRADPVYNGTARIGTAYGSASYVNTAAGGESSVSGVNELPIYVEKDTSVSAIAETYAKSAVSSVSGDYYPRYSNPSNFVQSANVVMRSSIGSSENFITSISGTPLMATDSALAKHVSDTASATAYQTASVNFGADAVSRSVFVSLTGPRTTYITAMDSYGGGIEYGTIDPTLDPDNYVYTGQYVVTSTAAVSARISTNYNFSASAICGYTVPLAHASALPTYQYNTADQISSINGSAIAGGGGGATGDYVEKSASSVAIGTSSESFDYSLSVGYKASSYNRSVSIGSSNFADSDSIAIGKGNSAYQTALSVGDHASAYHQSLALGFYAQAINGSLAIGDASASYDSFAIGAKASAYDNSIAFGDGVSSKFTSTVFGTYNKSGNGYDPSGAAFVIGDGTATASRHDLMVVTKDGEITMYSGTADTTGTGIMSSIRALSANAGGVDSATVSAIASSYAESAVSSYQPLSGMSGYASAFSAGEGLEFVQSGSDQVLQVEAPVDIVAGPGIVIDNPDGNTVRISTNANSFFKELYYNATNTNDTAGKVYALSEPITNFMYAKITVDNMEFNNRPLVYEIDVQHNTTSCAWNSPLVNGNVANTINLPVCQLQINASGNLVLVARGLTYNAYPSPLFTNGDSRGMRVVRVVGVFRIAGGN